MPRVPMTTVNLLSGYNVPQNDAHQFICSYCGYCANRSRNRWIQHMYDLHPPELESILDGNP